MLKTAQVAESVSKPALTEYSLKQTKPKLLHTEASLLSSMESEKKSKTKRNVKQ
jgi:hypothetical protein